tara:strand:- start:15 stop:233 length:219 start_codon:yes stop_codon:yes gene_type:complete
MILNFFILDGYGYFVWTSFFITLTVCFILFYKTTKELKKQETIYLKKFKKEELEEINIEEIKKKSLSTRVIS